MCFVREGEAQLISRNQSSLTERFPQLKQAGKIIQAATAILDGEIVALDEKGLPLFDGLRSKRTRSAVVFYAFDLLYLDGYYLSCCPLIKRKELLSGDTFGAPGTTRTCDPLIRSQVLYPAELRVPFW